LGPFVCVTLYIVAKISEEHTVSVFRVEVNGMRMWLEYVGRL
jgi:hypothetical protein